jgi:hypothetical protein
MSLLFGAVSFLVGLLMIFVGRPGSSGENPAFLRNGFAETFYPVTCLGLLVVGGAFIGQGLGLI